MTDKDDAVADGHHVAARDRRIAPVVVDAAEADVDRGVADGTGRSPRRAPAAPSDEWRLADHRAMQTARFARDTIIVIASAVFSVLFISYSRNTGHGFWVHWAPFRMAGGAPLLGIPSPSACTAR